MRHLGVQPPAGPPKTHLIEGEAYFSENLLQQADLKLAQSVAAEFYRTSCFQNFKLQCLNSIEDAFRKDLTTGLRDIHDFVK